MFKLSNRCSPVNCFCIATQYILSIDEWEKDNEQTTKLSIRNVEIPVRLVVLIFKHFKILILSFKKTPNNKKKEIYTDLWMLFLYVLCNHVYYPTTKPLPFNLSGNQARYQLLQGYSLVQSQMFFKMKFSLLFLTFNVLNIKYKICLFFQNSFVFIYSVSAFVAYTLFQQTT